MCLSCSSLDKLPALEAQHVSHWSFLKKNNVLFILKLKVTTFSVIPIPKQSCCNISPEIVTLAKIFQYPWLWFLLWRLCNQHYQQVGPSVYTSACTPCGAPRMIAIQVPGKALMSLFGSSGLASWVNYQGIPVHIPHSSCAVFSALLVAFQHHMVHRLLWQSVALRPNCEQSIRQYQGYLRTLSCKLCAMFDDQGL